MVDAFRWLRWHLQAGTFSLIGHHVIDGKNCNIHQYKRKGGSARCIIQLQIDGVRGPCKCFNNNYLISRHVDGVPYDLERHLYPTEPLRTYRNYYNSRWRETDILNEYRHCAIVCCLPIEAGRDWQNCQRLLNIRVISTTPQPGVHPNMEQK